MLRGTDIISGKIAVQLGLASAADVRAQLRALAADPDGRWDVVNGLSRAGKLDAKGIETVRHRTALYEHVRREAIYVRILERETTIKKEKVAKLLAQLEQAAFRRRLGEVLVRRGNIDPTYDREVIEEQRKLIDKEDERIVSRYQKEDFAGVERPLVPGSDLDPTDFKITSLFRSKKTRALVDKAELELLRALAERKQKRESGRLASPEPQARPRATQQEETADGEQTAKTLVMQPGVPAAPPGLDVHADTAKFDPGRVAEAESAAAAEAAAAPPAAAGAAGASLTPEQVRQLKRIADYTVVEVLGVGGMGAVFLGQKDGAGEYVAIKVLLNQAASEEERGRFEREIKLTRSIQHPNVLAIMDVGQTVHGLSYVVVPALAGKELFDLLQKAQGRGLEPSLAVRIFRQVFEGVGALHDQRVVHRDLKPENVFILAGGQYEVKIMDFGLAKPFDEAQDEANVFLTQGGEISGSPLYIAPESITNDPIDGRTDIYSLGVMFFEALTGKLPLESETTQGYLTQHMICPPLTLAEARPDLLWPPEVESLFERMLGKTRDERPESCRTIVAELDAGLAEQITSVRPTVTPQDDASDELKLDDPPDLQGWGVRGLLGRLWGA